MDVEGKLRELERRSASAGQPVTVQRRAALKALVTRWDHPTAESVYGDVVRELPGVSKATVYRALDNLVRLGLARRVHHDGVATRFDGNTDRHYHLHCIRCDGITDVEWESLDLSEYPNISAVGFEVHEISLSFDGECHGCVQKNKR